MKITRSKLESAVAEKIITREQADRLFDFFTSLPSSGPSFNFTHVLYYLGGLIAIGAMTVFMNLGWEQFGGWGLLFISLTYAGIGFILVEIFKNRGKAIPAGICATFIVAMAPLAIYGLQQAMGWWPDDSPYRDYHRYIKWHWIYLELGTLVVGAVLAWIYRYPFLQMPVAATLWYMSMDLTAMLVGASPDLELRALVSLHFGLIMTLLAFWIDIRSSQSGDYAFWLFLFGVMTLWAGLTAQPSDSELSKLVYFGINLVFIGIGTLLVRRIFVIFGAIGCTFYLAHLANEVFLDSWLFPIVLSAIGLGIVFLGIVWQKHEKRIFQKVRVCLPEKFQRMIIRRETC